METLPDIRPAVMDDLPGLALVRQLTWPEEEVNLSQAEKVLHDPAHEVFVASMQGQAVGFIDGFVTRSTQGELRWEVDLLAVHPDWRGRQLGQQLILACLQAGKRRGSAFARALIQVQNKASQISFARCGFHCQPAVLQLFVAPLEEVYAALPEAGAYLLPVNTINYSGLWLEEDASKRSLMAARAACWQAKCGLVGTLVFQTDLSDNEKMIELGFTEVGAYQWWTRKMDEIQDLSDGFS